MKCPLSTLAAAFGVVTLFVVQAGGLFPGWFVAILYLTVLGSIEVVALVRMIADKLDQASGRGPNDHDLPMSF